MNTNEVLLSNVKDGTSINMSLMVMKIIFKDSNKVVCIMANRSGSIKANIPCKKDDIKVGMVLKVEGIKEVNLDVKKYSHIEEYNTSDYLPTVTRSVDEIMDEIEKYTNEYVISREGKALNDYFFKDKEFLDKFKRCIGGVSMHHNYVGGLPEHTLSVMQLSAYLCEKYECRRPEIAVLGAKLHDIGKIYELYYDGPFKYTLRGEMEGHIVIGVEMLDKAFRENPNMYSEDFIIRMKGCLTQHHGTLEFGSPKAANMEESYIIHFADYVDATMNKICQMKEKVPADTWSEYEKKLDTKIYF